MKSPKINEIHGKSMKSMKKINEFQIRTQIRSICVFVARRNANRYEEVIQSHTATNKHPTSKYIYIYIYIYIRPSLFCICLRIFLWAPTTERFCVITVRFVLSNKNTCVLVQQEYMCSCSRRRDVFLLNKNTCILV
jgi:hypothetical protein